MDSGSRRDFIKATAAVGLVGASEASAQPAQSVQLAEAGNAGRASATPKPQIKIGFLHSMTLESGLEEAFLEGLRSTGAYEGDPKVVIDPATTTRVRIKKRIHSGNYGPSDDADDLGKLGKAVHGKNISLVIATGGVVAARAVWSATDPNTNPAKIFAIAGRADGAPAGAITWNLDSVTNDQDRLNKFISYFSPQLKPENVWLLYNSNSAMGSHESDVWPGGGSENANNGAHNEDMDLAKAFNNIAANHAAKAVMVSADPFFFSHRGLVITEAKQHKLKMCYPNTEFWKSANGDGSSISVGPTLASVYRDVGVKAAAYLANSSTTITPDPSVLQNRINGQAVTKR